MFEPEPAVFWFAFGGGLKAVEREVGTSSANTPRDPMTPGSFM